MRFLALVVSFELASGPFVLALCPLGPAVEGPGEFSGSGQDTALGGEPDLDFLRVGRRGLGRRNLKCIGELDSRLSKKSSPGVGSKMASK